MERIENIANPANYGGVFCLKGKKMCRKINSCLWTTNNKCTHPHPREDTDCYDKKGVSDLMIADDYATGVYKGNGNVWRQRKWMHK